MPQPFIRSGWRRRRQSIPKFRSGYGRQHCLRPGWWRGVRPDRNSGAALGHGSGTVGQFEHWWHHFQSGRRRGRGAIVSIRISADRNAFRRRHRQQAILDHIGAACDLAGIATLQRQLRQGRNQSTEVRRARSSLCVPSGRVSAAMKLSKLDAMNASSGVSGYATQQHTRASVTQRSPRIRF
jgi:hypothetical protein